MGWPEAATTEGDTLEGSSEFDFQVNSAPRSHYDIESSLETGDIEAVRSLSFADGGVEGQDDGSRHKAESDTSSVITPRELDEIWQRWEKILKILIGQATRLRILKFLSLGFGEKAIKNEYDPQLKRWKKQMVEVDIEAQPFRETAVVKEYRMSLLDQMSSEDGYILKIMKGEPKEWYFTAGRVQRVAQTWVRKFLDRNPPKRIKNVETFVFELFQRGGIWGLVQKEVVVAETGRKRRYGTSDGSEETVALEAFGHFCCVHSNKALVIHSDQPRVSTAATVTTTAPSVATSMLLEEDNNETLVVHCLNAAEVFQDAAFEEDYEANRGLPGIQKFIHTHECNSVCQYLGLPVLTPIEDRIEEEEKQEEVAKKVLPPLDTKRKKRFSKLLVEMFYKYDRNESGNLSRGELKTMIEKEWELFGIPRMPPPNATANLLNRLDQDQSGVVSIEEFVRKLLQMLAKRSGFMFRPKKDEEIGAIIAEAINPKSTVEKRQEKASLLRRAALLEVSKDLKQAEKLFVETLQHNPKNTPALVAYGNFLKSSRQDYSSAKMIYERALNVDPRSLEAMNNLANLMKNRFHEHKLAQSLYEQALRIDPYYLPALNNLATFHHRVTFKLDVAEELLTRAIKYHPNSPDAMTNFAVLLAEEKRQHGRAEGYFLRALGLSPSFNRALCGYACLVLQYHRDAGRAESLFCKMSENFTEGQIKYAEFLYSVKGERVKADKIYQRLLKGNPDMISLLQSYAEFLVSGDFGPERQREATDLYNTALKLDQNRSPKVLASYGRFLRMTGQQSSKAEECFQEALKTLPNSASVMNEYGILVFTSKRDFAGAETCFEAALAIDPDDYAILNNLGVVMYVGNRNTDAAQSLFRKSLDQNALCREACHNMSVLLSRKGDRAANEFTSRVKSLIPDPKCIMVTKGPNATKQ